MKAEYIDHMGDDLRVVNAARVSFNKESEWDYGGFTEHVDVDSRCIDVVPIDVLSGKDTKLIQYLSKNGHWTPFSHPQITVRETVPIFVARQRFKHMVGFTYNEVSRRYVDEDPEFFQPLWRAKSDNKKQGSAEPLPEGDARHAYFLLNEVEVVCESNYKELLEMGVCPEQARMVLPQSMYTSYYVTGSLAAWARAYKQRTHPHSQIEIQELAAQWDTLIAPLFPVSWKALTQD